MLQSRQQSLTLYATTFYGSMNCISQAGSLMLYVNELRIILKIFKKRRIRVNYLGITTNMSIQSQEFADVYNEWADYIKRPDESGLEVSIDPFHLEFITRYQIDQNIAFYREKCPSLKAKERIATLIIQCRKL